MQESAIFQKIFLCQIHSKPLKSVLGYPFRKICWCKAPLISSGSWNNPIFEMRFLLFFKFLTILLPVRSWLCFRKSLSNTTVGNGWNHFYGITLADFIPKPQMNFEFQILTDLKMLPAKIFFFSKISRKKIKSLAFTY